MKTRSQGGATPTDPAPPAQFQRLGRFELRRMLGGGAFGVVHLAWDPQLERDVAVKVPRSGLLADQTDVERFIREARAAAQLRHPHIVAVYEAGKAGSTHYIASAYVVGCTLREELKEGRRYTAAEAALLIAQLAHAVDYAHTQGVIHRDLKPSNVMLDDQGEPHLLDFGLARRAAGDGLRTLEGIVLGTPAYMSPEQAQGQGHLADGRSDLWSLGVMLYELLTGRRPFEGNDTEIMMAIRTQEPARLRSPDRSIPRDLETIVLKCLAKAPGERYATCAELASELEHWLRGEPVAARPMGAAEHAWRWTRRNPVVAALGLAAVSLLLTITAGAVLAATNLAESRAELNLALARVERETEEANRQSRRARQALDRLTAEEAARIQEEALRNQAARDREQAEKDAERRNNALKTSQEEAAEARRRREQKEAESRQAVQAAEAGRDNAAQALREQQQRERDAEWIQGLAEYANLLGHAQKALGDQQLDQCAEYLEACPADHRGWEWGYLKNLAAGHQRSSQSIAPTRTFRFSEDSRWLVVVSGEGNWRVFDAATGRDCFAGAAQHQGPWFISDGMQFVTFARNYFWFRKLPGGELLDKDRAKGHLDSHVLLDVVWRPGERLWAISFFRDAVSLQNLQGRESLDGPTPFPLRSKLAGSSLRAGACTAALCPDERTLAVAAGQELYLWDLQRQRGDLVLDVGGQPGLSQPRKLPPQRQRGDLVLDVGGRSTALVFAPDGSQITSAILDGHKVKTRLWDVATGDLLADQVLTVAETPPLVRNRLPSVHPDGKRMAMIQGQSWVVCDTSTGQVLLSAIEAPAAPESMPTRYSALERNRWESAVAFSSDGKRLAVLAGGRLEIFEAMDP